MPFSYRDETKELNDISRREVDGSFIRLSDGFTHYELSAPLAASPREGDKSDIVLVHGFSVPYFIYDPTFKFLTQCGFRVLRYDLFGRGFSDRPDTRYNIDLFIRQLGELLDALRFTRPVSLVGLSTGGPITAAFTARFPERVDKLVLIDPVGAKPLAITPILKVATLPLVGEAVAGLVRSDRINGTIACKIFESEFVEHFQSRYLPQMQFKGFRRAILSTIRNNMLGSFLEVYEHIGKIDKPVLLFWGRNDPTVPFHHSDVLRRVIPNVQFHAVENCGHIPHYAKPEVVHPILLRFLAGQADQ